MTLARHESVTSGEMMLRELYGAILLLISIFFLDRFKSKLFENIFLNM